MDDTANALLDAGESIPSDPPGPVAAMDELRSEIASLNEVRSHVYDAPADVLSAAQSYDHLQDDAIGLLDAIARASNSAEATEKRGSAEFLVRSADLLARSTSVVVGAAVGAGGLPSDLRTYYLEQSGAYDAELAEVASISPRLGQNELATFEALRGSAAAATLDAARTVLAEPRDPDAAPGAAPPVAVAAHDSAAAELVDGLHRLGTEELRQGDAKDQEQAADQVRTAVVLATLLLVLAGVVLAVAVIMVNRLVRRLARLRDDTLRRAEHDLPAAVARVRAGRGDVLEAPVVHHGHDEIDEVAAAFDRPSTPPSSRSRRGGGAGGLHRRVPQHRPPQPGHRAPAAEGARRGRARRDRPRPARAAVPARPPGHARAAQRREPDHPRRWQPRPAVA